MNKFIANIFSGILSLIHIVVIVGFVLVILNYQKNKDSVVGIFGSIAYESGAFYGILFLIFLLYVLFIGLLSTFVAINENLEEINSTLKNNNK